MSDERASIDRMGEVVQQWFLSEPWLFSAWTTHRVQAQPRIATIRVGRGLVEFNPAFVTSLDQRTLRDVMQFEAVRILLKHPYERRQPNAALSYEASNLAIQECVPSPLDIPKAVARFGTDEHDGKHFEYYYQLLSKRSNALPLDQPSTANEDDCGNCLGQGVGRHDPECEAGDHHDASEHDGAGPPDSSMKPYEPPPHPTAAQASPSPSTSTLATYCGQADVALENTVPWSQDAFLSEQINRVMADIEASQSWGTLPGNAQERILASQTPKLDYRRVLRAFRANLLSTQRRLTRMKPSRRYGFAYLGSRRDFSTKLLFAVDVSGSVDSTDVQTAFSIVNRLFKYGMESIDVIWFDTEIRNTKPLALRRAAREFSVQGRGGTNFQPVMDYVNDHRQYDGLIVFTDGIAPIPHPPRENHRTRIVWLFNHENNWRRHRDGFERQQMLSAFVRHD